MSSADVDAYLAALPPARSKALERVRRIVTAAVPEAEESISYDMPTYKYQGQRLIYFANNKQHMSLYGPISAVEHKLGDFKLSHRGTVQFTEDHPIPEDIIREIVLLRRQAIDQSL